MGHFQVLMVLTSLGALSGTSHWAIASPSARRANLFSLKAPARGVKMTRVIKPRYGRSLEDEPSAAFDDATVKKRSASADPVYPYGGYQFQSNAYRHGRPGQQRSHFYNTHLDSIIYRHFVPHELGKRSAAPPPSYRGFAYRANSSLQNKKTPQARSKKVG
ncbi:uncharacterized protein LOC131883159 [Tigriopus californicus]|nr:uncharacterized protein LOC131883159 [Tigriopus californicus]